VAINGDYLGRTFPATAPYEVSRVKIADFAEAIGDRNPLYTDAAAAQAAGYPDVIAPPTFPIVITMAASRAAIADPGLGINYAMVVHGEQRFSYARPLRAVHDLGDPRGGQHDDGDHRHRDQDHRRRTGLHRLRHPGGAGERMTRFADVTAGTELPVVSYPVTRLSLVKYCGASGDFNVIHWNERIARSVGLPNVIAHGMFTMAQAGRYVTDWAGDAGALVEFGVRFSAMVPVPDDDTGATIEVSGTVEEKLDGNLVAVALTARSGDAKVLTRARAVVRLP
jgi:acyl dehydratase